MIEKHFPNGFSSWQETHYEVVSAITLYMEKHPECGALYNTGERYDLAETLTDEFEKIHEDRVWDGDFFDEIEDFMSEKLNDL